MSELRKADQDQAKLKRLLAEIRACRICAPALRHEPRPAIRAATTARLIITGQAPGNRVHETGLSWNDRSGDRLREWTGLAWEDFYDETKIALMSMGFCFPGTVKGADLPPRKECAPLWHDRLRAEMPKARLTLLVGSYAQARYLPQARKLTLEQRVRGFKGFLQEGYFPLPHPSWRTTGWIKQRPWFTQDVLPALKAAVAAALQ